MLRKNLAEIIIKKRVNQFFSRRIYLYDYFKNIYFLDLMENRLLNIWKSLSVPDENGGKTTELFDISTIVYGQGNVLRTM